MLKSSKSEKLGGLGYSKKSGLPFSKHPIWDKLEGGGIRYLRMHVNIFLKVIVIFIQAY